MVITDELLEKKKRNALEILRYFIGFCNRHGLRYYCAFGTAIGAVRHKGFIPWDDDIDVQMPRPDYEKLMSLKAEIEASGFELREPRSERAYSATYAKICDSRTSLMELEEMPVMLGNFIDVFPLDGKSDIPEEYQRDYLCSQRLRSRIHGLGIHHDSRWIVRKMTTFKIGTVYYYLKNSILRNRQRQAALRKFERLALLHPYESSKELTCYGMWSQYDRLNMPKEWYGKGITFSFEGLDVLLPEQYDKVLRRTYGDYMLLPPSDQRESTHKCFYINLDRRVSIEEARNAASVIKEELS